MVKPLHHLRWWRGSHGGKTKNYPKFRKLYMTAKIVAAAPLLLRKKFRIDGLTLPVSSVSLFYLIVRSGSFECGIFVFVLSLFDSCFLVCECSAFSRAYSCRPLRQHFLKKLLHQKNFYSLFLFRCCALLLLKEDSMWLCLSCPWTDVRLIAEIPLFPFPWLYHISLLLLFLPYC